MGRMVRYHHRTLRIPIGQLLSELGHTLLVASQSQFRAQRPGMHRPPARRNVRLIDMDPPEVIQPRLRCLHGTTLTRFAIQQEVCPEAAAEESDTADLHGVVLQEVDAKRGGVFPQLREQPVPSVSIELMVPGHVHDRLVREGLAGPVQACGTFVDVAGQDEYLAHVHDKPFDGVLFSSVQRAGGVNIVLFPEKGLLTDVPMDAFRVKYVDDSVKLVSMSGILYSHRELEVNIARDGEPWVYDGVGPELDDDLE